MQTLWIALVLAIAALPAWAGGVSTELQVKLQSAMLNFTDGLLVDGGYTYIDPKAEAVRTVYPANVHPFVVKFGADYFVCSEMITEAGDTITADYLVREIDGDYRVVQIILDNRDLVKTVSQKQPN